MNCKKISQSDLFFPARFVFAHEGEHAPKEKLAEPGMPPPDAPAKPTDKPSDAVVAKRANAQAVKAAHDEAQKTESAGSETVLQQLDATPTPPKLDAPAAVPEPAPSDDAKLAPISVGAEVAVNAGTVAPAAAPAANPASPENSASLQTPQQTNGTPDSSRDYSDAAVTAVVKRWAGKPEAEIAKEDDPILEYARKDITNEESKKALENAQKLLKPEWDKKDPPIVAALPTPTEIDKLATDKKIDYREARALREKLKTEVEAGKEIPRVTEDELTKFKEKMGIKDKDPSWMTGDGTIAVLIRAFTKLFEGIGKLMGMLADKVGKMFGGDEKLPEHFAKSPIAGNGKFTLVKGEKGVDLTGDVVSADVQSVTAGKIESIDSNNHTITIKSGDNKMIYTNLDPNTALAVGNDVAEGATLGKLTGNILNFQMKNEQDQQLESTTLLATYTKPAAAPNPAPAATVANAPTAAPSPAPTAAPTAAPTKPPEKTPADLQKELIAKTNENLKKYAGETVDLKTKDFSFPLPYIEGQEIKTVTCTIHGNTFKVGTFVFEMKLPANANLQSIKFEGTAQGGTAEITAGKLIWSDTKEIPLKELLVHLEKLRSGPASDSIQVGSDTATLTKTA